MAILIANGKKVDVEAVSSAENRYAVDREGNVYSLVRRFPKKLRPVMNSDGYHKVSIHYVAQKRKLVSIHRMVAEAFIPMEEGKAFVNHKNGIKTDNRVENLEWVTSKENVNHAIKSGLLVPPYNDQGLRDESDAKAAVAKALRRKGVAYKEIAATLGCSLSTAHRYVHRASRG